MDEKGEEEEREERKEGAEVRNGEWRGGRGRKRGESRGGSFIGWRVWVKHFF